MDMPASSFGVYHRWCDAGSALPADDRCMTGRAPGPATPDVAAGASVLRAGNHPQAHFAIPARAREHTLNEARFALAKFRRTTLPDTLVARPALHDQLTTGADKRGRGVSRRG